jgi:hypothetical protein
MARRFKDPGSGRIVKCEGEVAANECLKLGYREVIETEKKIEPTAAKTTGGNGGGKQ